ncbi:hypothetical protein MG293_005051 [Ovis ammon polii]|uniref:Uncharacterized protein n=1 Tax=Ovis ammon polii TaxID=230172 RepID=A0AAD4UIS4_OVIAM|nr:hypothetical protein MG293_005051 [Ovis ammon polii]
MPGLALRHQRGLQESTVPGAEEQTQKKETGEVFAVDEFSAVCGSEQMSVGFGGVQGLQPWVTQPLLLSTERQGQSLRGKRVADVGQRLGFRGDPRGRDGPQGSRERARLEWSYEARVTCTGGAGGLSGTVQRLGRIAVLIISVNTVNVLDLRS